MLEKVNLSEKKNISLGAILSYATIFASLLLSFFYTRFILENLGEVNCSIRNVATSTVSYLGLISLGMGTAYFRFRKQKEKEGGIEAAKRFNGLFFICFTIFGTIAFLLGILLVILAKTGFFKVEDPSKAYLLVPVIGITVLNVSISFPLSVFNFIENYHRKFFFANLINLIDTILLPVSSMVVILLLRENNSPDQLTIIVTWVAFVEALVIKAIHIIYVVFHLKDKISLKVKKEDFKVMKPIIVFSFFAFIVTMISKIHTSTDQVILSAMINTTAALIYSYSMLFHTYTNTAITTITNLFTPRLTSDAMENNVEDMNKVFDILSGAITILVTLILGGFIAVGKDFVTIWLRTLSAEDHKNIYIFGVLLISCCLFSAYSNLLYSYHIAKNKHKFAALFYIGSFLVNVIISVLLCIPFGILGTIIGTIIVSVGETIGMTIYTRKILTIKWQSYVYNLIRNLVILGISIGLFFIIFKFIPLGSLNLIIQFLIKGFSFVILFGGFELLINRKFIKYFLEVLKRK